MNKPTNSPWGKVQICSTFAPGVHFVSTASHGGLMIGLDAAKRLLGNLSMNRDVWFRKRGTSTVRLPEMGYYCFEEDCEIMIPLYESEELRKLLATEGNPESQIFIDAQNCLRSYYPGLIS